MLTSRLVNGIVFDVAELAIERYDPSALPLIFNESENGIVRQAIGGSVGAKLVAIVARHAPVGSNPHVAARIL